ncbi:MAG: beta-ketoacyl-ACP synthase II [Deltaproteobacteria bacterium]|nr:beta-ketoacyl-ACP synthase II [Deltaproteobacteria bacterium]MBI3294323.1 beta-ketoacyl-ACP synthase II [Deltaproteobacteria bacterium]
MPRIVVTGIGAISPIGLNAQQNWDSLMKGVSGVGTITQFDAAQYSCRIAGEVKGYQADQHIPIKDIKKMERFIQFALVASDEALKGSGIDKEKEDLDRIGCCIGVGLGGLAEIQAQHKELMEKGPRRVSPFFIPMVIANLAAGQVSIRYGFRGPNTCITTACSSSSHSIGEAMRLIQRGDVDVMVAGGAEAVICELGVAGFCALRALSSRNDEPTRASRPFDKDRDGFVMGEGAAVLILENLEHAQKRGAKILAEIVGYGLNADAYHMTQPSPNGEGGANCMRLALKDAKLSADRIGYVNAHGTSTPIGDIMETTAIKSVFRDHAKKLTVSSTKSMTGHLLGAAGAIEAMYCVQALMNQVVPPTINLENPSPECDLNYVANRAQERKLDYALSNSFGFGGTNGCLILKKA